MADDETKTTTTTTTIMEDTGKKDAPSDSGEKRKRKKNKGFLVRLWNGIFGRRGEDYEKRLQYLSKEEAAVHARMKRRAQGWRKTARNVILCSVVAEVAAVIYAILMTRSVELSWQMRSLRVLPMFAFPGFSYVIYSTLASFTRMRDRKDQNTLERLRAERQAKIDELKEKTNYYTTQQLIQQYDLDPAAKAAAATVLASKLGADSGLKVFLGDESNANASLRKSNDVELVQSDGLRNRKQSGGRSQGTGTSVSEQFVGDETAQDVSHGGQEAAFQGQRVVEHYRGSGPNEGGWIARLAAMLVGEDPSQSYALICGSCRMHNGLAKKEDFPYITYYCPHCQAFNGPSQSDNPGPGPGSPFCNVIAPSGDAGIARTISNTSSTVSEADASKQHLEGNTGREPDEQKVE